tara:strand:+ start:1448 stop:2413 length:966 start_codon:yes stop_codon:yes gene_type:complete
MKSKILPIAGDASFRTFYRLTSKKKKSKIIVVAKKEKYKNLVAYTAINRFLRNHGILAPKLYDYNFNKGIIIIEDFGNSSIYDTLLKRKNKLLIYKKLIDLLLRIQKIEPKFKIKNIKNNSHLIYKYSKKYLHKESDLFFDWYLPQLIGKKKSINLKNKGKKILSKLYNKLNFPNCCFVHRDYHSQNLIKVGKKIGIIDSQDALIGNPAYDLVSLIDDVRIKTTRKLKKQILNYYLKKNTTISKKDSNKFLEDFDILSIQRNLKIIGIFSRLFKRDKKKKYLKFIPYAWDLIEQRISREIFLDLKKILDKNISKKQRNKKY